VGRIYTIDTGFQSVSAVQDLLEVVVPADAVMLLHSVQIDQTSDVTAADAESLIATFKRGISNTSGSGGASVTPEKLQSGDAAAGITAERNNTTQAVAGGGSLATLWTDAFDVLAGYEKTFTPELRPVFSPSQSLIISLAAPADALTLRALVTVEEIGG